MNQFRTKSHAAQTGLNSKCFFGDITWPRCNTLKANTSDRPLHSDVTTGCDMYGLFSFRVTGAAQFSAEQVPTPLLISLRTARKFFVLRSTYIVVTKYTLIYAARMTSTELYHGNSSRSQAANVKLLNLKTSMQKKMKTYAFNCPCCVNLLSFTNWYCQWKQ